MELGEAPALSPAFSLPRWTWAGRQPRHHLPGLPSLQRRHRQGVPECHDLPHQHPQVRVAELRGGQRGRCCPGGSGPLTAGGIPSPPLGRRGLQSQPWDPTEPGDPPSLCQGPGPLCVAGAFPRRRPQHTVALRPAGARPDLGPSWWGTDTRGDLPSGGSASPLPERQGSFVCGLPAALGRGHTTWGHSRVTHGTPRSSADVHLTPDE